MRSLFVLFALMGILFMHGVCADAGVENAPHAPVATAADAASVSDDLAGDHHPGQHHDQDSCHTVTDADHSFLATAVFLLLLALYPTGFTGAHALVSLPGRVMRALRHEAVGRVPRLALCVMRV